MKAFPSFWTEDIAARHNGLLELRREFHRHPELSFQERQTARVVAQRLAAAGLEVRTEIGETGVVGILRGGKPGRTVAWRADMDALPLTEVSDLPFASRVPGVMHACGHDGHTAIAVTLAEILAARLTEVAGTVVFIFQPAEEIGGGAKVMIEAGVLDNPRVEAVYGLHLISRYPAGQVAVRPGPFMASADSFLITVRGKGGHGALPHQAIDPIPIAAHIVLGMQNLVAREVSARERVVLTVGQIVAGTKRNIIPATAEMHGTLRTLNPIVRNQMIERLQGLATQLARAYRADAEISFPEEGIPPVINDPMETANLRRYAAEELGSERVGEGDFAMASDDMSRFLQERPGCYFLVGAGPDNGDARPHHSPEFEMNEAALSVGLRVALRLILGAESV